jgi:putative flippase GtrA
MVKTLSAAQRVFIVQFVKFGIVGVIGYFVDYGILEFCVRVLGTGPYLGRVFSFLFGASTTWICNRLFTFRGQGSGHAGRQWAKFVVVCLGGFVLNCGTYALLITYVPFVYAHLWIGVAAGSVAGMFFNFFAARKLVFR